MFNKVFLIGRLTKDPEIRTTSSGISVAKFTVAVDRIRKQNGEKVTDFLRVVVWRKLADIAGQYLKKGKLTYIEGRFQIDQYNQNGIDRESAEIIADNFQMLDRATDRIGEEIIQN